MEENEVLACKEELFNSLGENFKTYSLIMRKWFDMEMSKSQLVKELNRILTPEQYHLHKVLLTGIIDKSLNQEEESTRLPRNFQPEDSFFYDVIERHKVHEITPPPLMCQTRSVITRQIAINRFKYGAKELQLKSIKEPVADLLTIATRHFLKNLITGMVCRRKNYKVKPNGFVHDVGSTVMNPWNRNVFNRKKSNFHPLIMDARYEGLLVPNPRPSREELERERALGETASDSPSEHLLPLSLTDLIVTLQVNPNLIPSNYVKTINMQRIYAKIRHPTWDE